MFNDQTSTPNDLGADKQHGLTNQARTDGQRWSRRAAVAAGCLGLGLACAAFEVAYSVKIVPWLTDESTGAYSLPADIWRPMPAARWVANGALLFIYEASSPRYDYGPLWPVILAPAVAIGDHLNLLDNSRYAVPRPTMAIPMIMVAVTAAMAALAAAAWRITATRAPKARLGAIAAAVGPAMIATGSWFHGEDILIAAFILLAAASPVAAAWWTAAALLTKQTMLAYVPALLAACEPGRRHRFVMIAAGVPAAVMAMILAATPKSLFTGVTGAPTCADCFRPALWTQLIWDDPAEVSANYGRVAWIAAAAVTAWLWRHRCRETQGLLAVLTAITLMRCMVFEAGVYAYYWVPAILFTLVLSTRDGRSLWPSLSGFAGLMAWHSVSTDMPLPLWWAVTITATAIVWHPVLRSLGRPGRVLAGSPQAARKPANAAQ